MLEIRPIGTANLPDAARLCLAGATPGDRPRAFTRDVEVDCTRCKLGLLFEGFAEGVRCYAAYNAGMLVGYLETHPEARAPAPIQGAGCTVIGCLRVPEAHARAEVESALIEHAANAIGAGGGLAVIGREKDWSTLGFETVEREASEVISDERVLWWRSTGGEAPALIPIDRALPRVAGRVRVDLFTSDRCPWDRYVTDLVRGVVERMRDVVVFETDCSDRREIVRTGVVSAVAVNGTFQPWFRPHHLPDDHQIRRTIEAAS